VCCGGWVGVRHPALPSGSGGMDGGLPIPWLYLPLNPYSYAGFCPASLGFLVGLWGLSRSGFLPAICHRAGGSPSLTTDYPSPLLWLIRFLGFASPFAFCLFRCVFLFSPPFCFVEAKEKQSLLKLSWTALVKYKQNLYIYTLHAPSSLHDAAPRVARAVARCARTDLPFLPFFTSNRGGAGRVDDTTIPIYSHQLSNTRRIDSRQ